MRIEENFDLSTITSFGSGGKAEKLVRIESSNDFITALTSFEKPFWILGSGANVLISDKGLPGTTIKLEATDIERTDSLLIADAGAVWDDLVLASIDAGSWGLEMMSGIPGSVGAAIHGNIAAYGQAAKDTLAWVEVVDYQDSSPALRQLTADEIEFSYRSSSFSSPSNSLIITRVAYAMYDEPTHEVKYQSALKVFSELGLDTNVLIDRRVAIMEARRRAGSLLDEDNRQKTAGSFFKNPSVSPEQVAKIIESEEQQDISSEHILKQNQVHGGDVKRVSAAHVLLAAGFQRGQTWGPVRLHPDHVLKIENTGGATSQQIHDVAMEIIQTVKQTLDVELEPEVKFLGEFTT